MFNPGGPPLEDRRQVIFELPSCSRAIPSRERCRRSRCGILSWALPCRGKFGC